MVYWVNVAIEEGRAHRVCARANDQVASHDISLEPCRLESSHVFSSANQHFSAKMAALLYSRLLVLQVDASCSSVDEHLN